MKTALSGIAIILGILGLMWWGWSNQTSLPNQGQAGTSALTVTETLHDFGEISMARGIVEKMFEVTNPTDRDITLRGFTTSCMCTTAFIVKDGLRRGPFGMPGHGGSVPRANEVIPAGSKLAIAVVYDPAAHGPAGVGPTARLVYLEDETGAVLELEIKANVTP